MENDRATLYFTPYFCRKPKMAKFETQNYYPNTCLDIDWASLNFNLILPKRKPSPDPTHGYNGYFLGCMQQNLEIHEKSHFFKQELGFQPISLSISTPSLSRESMSSHSNMVLHQDNVLSSMLQYAPLLLIDVNSS